MTDRAMNFDDLQLETMLFARHVVPVRRSGSEQQLRLERSGYTLLLRIRAEQLMSIPELSEALGLDVSTLNRQTAALQKSGHLERVPDPAGGIARKFRVTAAGLADLEADRQARAAGLQRLLSTWSKADIDQFAGHLRRFNSDLESIDGRPWPRD
ncbi:MarR family transcriptional regulator [Nocardioides sp. W7]|uniref:MarR family winged helix-turn-helix transcriptional regulator n=1 Tax=Nocardioides sp. W7 TaxID=2931390 RepID=UPI001FD3E9AE|nr:MarR family transcriptional regulator [Nocardioides sp. W7]